MMTNNMRLGGAAACYATALLLCAYVVTMVIGLAMLPSPDSPIQNPFFTIMEILIIIIMLPITLALLAFHESYTALDQTKSCCSYMSLGMLFIATSITSSVHAVVISANRSELKDNFEFFDSFFSFNWPSVVYALDILAWDWFFALSMLFAAPVVPGWKEARRLERVLQVLFLVSGLLSLLGLIAIPLDDIRIRMIGIGGYALITIPLFCVLGILLSSMNKTSCRATNQSESQNPHQTVSLRAERINEDQERL